MIKHKIRYRIATLLSALALLTAGCSDDTTENTAQTDRLVTDQLVPGSTFYTSTTRELTIQGKGFAEGDALALADIASGRPYDCCSVRLDAAAALLGEVTGLDSPEEVLNRVFSSFCIGK